MLQNAPIKKIPGEAFPRTPPPSKRLATYVTRRKQLRGMQLALPPPKSYPPPLDKSYILSWTTTKKFIFEEIRS